MEQHVIVIVLTLSVVDCWIGLVKQNTIKLVFVASLLNMQHCLPTVCFFRELAPSNPTQHVGLIQSGHDHHLLKM